MYLLKLLFSFLCLSYFVFVQQDKISSSFEIWHQQRLVNVFKVHLIRIEISIIPISRLAYLDISTICPIYLINDLFILFYKRSKIITWFLLNFSKLYCHRITVFLVDYFKFSLLLNSACSNECVVKCTCCIGCHNLCTIIKSKFSLPFIFQA